MWNRVKSLYKSSRAAITIDCNQFLSLFFSVAYTIASVAEKEPTFIQESIYQKAQWFGNRADRIFKSPSWYFGRP